MRFLKRSKGFKVSLGVLLVLMIFLFMGYEYISARCSASVYCGRLIGTIWCQTFGRCDEEQCGRVGKCIYCDCWIGDTLTSYEDCCSWY
ncbi:MAG: hypothetical protein ACFFDN_22675 [Candidatus Hodarchaeota archaeon]